MNKKIKNELTDKLFECILSMETVEECYQLFEDLCTINEIQAIAQRMEVAAMLMPSGPMWKLRKKQALPQQLSAVSIVACITARMAISWRLTV